MTEEKFIREAIALAYTSAQAGFDPFGAILVKEGTIMASTSDRSILYSDPTAHAELVLISEYCRKHQLISLEGYSLYSSAEPCIMCSGAIHWAKLDKVIFSVSQEALKKSSSGNPKPTCKQLLSFGGKNVEVIGPILEEEGLKVIQAFPWKSKKQRHADFFKKK